MENNPKNAEFLVVPYPMQGHVAPMMKLSECIASHGVNVTLVVTEHNYKGMLTKSMIDRTDEENRRRRVTLVTIPDGLEPEDDRKDHVKVATSVFKVMPDHVYNLIAKVNKQGGNNNDNNNNNGGGGGRITCLIADIVFGWAPKVAENAGIKLALFWTSSPGALASTLRIPELIESGFIDQEGNPLRKDGEIQLLSDIPSMKATELPWYNHPKEGFTKNDMFKTFCASEQVIRKATWLLCNWCHELTPSATKSNPNVVPIGPLLADTQHSETLYPEDSLCLLWLDQQPPRSVVYVAFGSISTLTQNQLNELAQGLELSGRRFLWVVREDLTTHTDEVELPAGFEERVASCGKLVKWASQEKVLAHPSIACFLTHCGWNSTIEGLSNGVPLICWPCFADQPYTRTCVCDAWKIGISLGSETSNNASDGRIISANEVRSKIDELMSRDDLIANALKVKATIQLCASEGGTSFTNMKGFIEQAQV